MVVPAHNEEKLIGRVIEIMLEYIDYIVVVDDASSDNTLNVVEKYRKKLREIIIMIKHEKIRG